jgi:hypothetical protein
MFATYAFSDILAASANEGSSAHKVTGVDLAGGAELGSGI